MLGRDEAAAKVSDATNRVSSGQGANRKGHRSRCYTKIHNSPESKDDELSSNDALSCHRRPGT